MRGLMPASKREAPPACAALCVLWGTIAITIACVTNRSGFLLIIRPRSPRANPRHTRRHRASATASMTPLAFRLSSQSRAAVAGAIDPVPRLTKPVVLSLDTPPGWPICSRCCPALAVRPAPVVHHCSCRRAALDQNSWRRKDASKFLGIFLKVLLEKIRNDQISDEEPETRESE